VLTDPIRLAEDLSRSYGRDIGGLEKDEPLDQGGMGRLDA